jgi:IS5 family transposase
MCSRHRRSQAAMPAGDLVDSTIWRFRQELAAGGLAEALFAEINRQLDVKGLIVCQGTLIDATLLAAAVEPPSTKEGTVSERDPEAGWTVKNGRSHFGYKARRRRCGVDAHCSRRCVITCRSVAAENFLGVQQPYSKYPIRTNVVRRIDYRPVTSHITK